MVSKNFNIRPESICRFSLFYRHIFSRAFVSDSFPFFSLFFSFSFLSYKPWHLVPATLHLAKRHEHFYLGHPPSSSFHFRFPHLHIHQSLPPDYLLTFASVLRATSIESARTWVVFSQR